MAAKTQTAERLSELLAKSGPLDGDRALLILRQIVAQVAELHAAGKLARLIRADRIAVDADTAHLAAADSAAAIELDNDSLPPEIGHERLPPLPEPIEEARAALKSIGRDIDPRRIDIFQLGCLACEMLTGGSPQTYLFSPRAKARVAVPWRRVLDAMLGYDPALRIDSCDQLQVELERISVDGPQPINQDTPRRGTGIDAHTNTPRTPYPAATPLPFQKLGDYQIVARLGSGGMGDVYQAYDPRLERTVAAKVLPLELARQSDFVRRFVDEAKAAAQLVHPNIVQIYSIGEDEGHHYFAMQYVAGETLAARIKREQLLSLDDTLAIIEQLLSGLAVAHRRGMIHRDIKPGNILLDSEHGRALLADFGLVKSLDSSEQMTATGMVMGTVDYISPEQGRGHKVDTRSDLYSVGVLIYQMLSGKLPFVAESATAMIFQHAYEKPRPLEDAVPNVAPGASAIVRRLLAKDPADRYQTAEDLLADVQKLHASHDWRPTTVAVKADSNKLAAIAAKTQEYGDEDQRLTVALAPLPRPRWQDRLRVLFHLHAPALLKNLQNTEHQVDGALAVYQDRRDKLAQLAHEAAAVEHALTEQGLETELRQQQAEREEIELRLAKADATLQKLRSQQGLLRARLRTVEAERILSDTNAPQSGRFSPRLVRAAIIGLAMLTASILLFYFARPTPDFVGSEQIQTSNTLPEVIVPSTGWVSLTPFINVQRDALGGVWESVDDTISNQPLASPSISNFLKIPLSIRGSYELRFKYRIAEAPSRGVNILLPMHDARGALVIGQVRRREGIGINGIRGLSSVDAANPTSDPNFENPSDVEREALVRVESPAAGILHVAVMIDGQKQIDWSGNEADVHTFDSSDDSLARQRLKLPKEPILILHSWGNKGVFRQVALRMLDGSATPLYGAVPSRIASSIQTPADFPDTILPSADWVSLMPLVDIQNTLGNGTWNLTNGAINRSGPRKIGFLKIPLLIRGSYEFRFNYRITSSGHSGLSLRMPFGNVRGGPVIGRLEDDPGIMLNDVHGQDSNNTAKSTYNPSFANASDAEREALVRIEPNGAGAVHATLTINGQKQIDALSNEADFDGFDVRGQALPHEPILILGAWGNGISYSQLALRMLDGSATRWQESETTQLSPIPNSPLDILTSDKWKWSTPVNAGPLINSDKNESGSFLSADGLTLLFESERSGGVGKHDIWMAQRYQVDEPWGQPVNLGTTINSEFRDYHSSMTADGLELYFNSDRPGGVGSDGLYMSTRPNVNAPWGKPMNLEQPINGVGITRASCISPDGLTLILGSDRPGGVGHNDLWITRRKSTSDPWGPIDNLGSQVNSESAEKHPNLSSDGLVLVFHSDRVARWKNYMYMATRPSLSEPFGETVNLGPIVNGTGFDESPALSADGQTLWFSSVRAGGYGGHDLWYSQRVKR